MGKLKCELSAMKSEIKSRQLKLKLKLNLLRIQLRCRKGKKAKTKSNLPFVIWMTSKFRVTHRLFKLLKDKKILISASIKLLLHLLGKTKMEMTKVEMTKTKTS